VITVQRILCPIDLSDASRQALDYAVELARWYESTITILHVDDSRGLRGPAADRGDTTLRPTVADEVDAFCRPWTAAVERVEVLLSAGHVVSEIAAISDRLPADLLVLGTHGRGGFERLWLGSVSEKVLRKVRCPVLTVPPHARASGEEIAFKSILCPIDFSDSSLRALEYAFAIAEETLACLVLLHVVEPLAEMGFKDESAAFAVPEYERHLTDDAARRLAALIPAEARSWCQPETRVVSGKPHREILSDAASNGAQLIVMGVHGRGVLDLTLFGSTTHHVVRGASCPVLTLRSAELAAR
jgi:nucleotide-binding universal stress UspA family protein